MAVGTISELALAAERDAAAELRSCIPAHNAACLAFLANAGAHAAWLSPELSLTEIELLAPQSPITLGITVLGKPRVMTSEHCILQVADACIHDCERCSLRRRKLVLHNIDDKLLPVRTDIHGRSHLYDAYALDYTPHSRALRGCRRNPLHGRRHTARTRGACRPGCLGHGAPSMPRSLASAPHRARRARAPAASSPKLSRMRAIEMASMPNTSPDILFVNDTLVAVDKPAGIIVHGDGTGALTLTDMLREAILAGKVGRCDETNPDELQALQRLDRDTTGIVLFSRCKSTQPLYDRLIAEHGFEKRYLAIARGRARWTEQTLDAPIGRDRHDARRMRVSRTGKPARTHVRVLDTRHVDGEWLTLLDVSLETGRKHQIRVHLAHEGLPLFGDALYGKPDPRGLMLHAHELAFTDPVTGKPLRIVSPAAPTACVSCFRGT